MSRLIRILPFLAFIGCDLVVTFSHDELTIVAHLGGALAGVLLGVIILKDWHVNRKDLICQIISAFLFLVMALTVMSLMIVDRQKHANLIDSASGKADTLVKKITNAFD